VQGEEAPGRDFSAVWIVGFSPLVPDLYEIIQYTLSLSLPCGFLAAVSRSLLA
jgi:hypothetical protein